MLVNISNGCDKRYLWLLQRKYKIILEVNLRFNKQTEKWSGLRPAFLPKIRFFHGSYTPILLVQTNYMVSPLSETDAFSDAPSKLCLYVRHRGENRSSGGSLKTATSKAELFVFRTTLIKSWKPLIIVPESSV